MPLGWQLYNASICKLCPNYSVYKHKYVRKSLKGIFLKINTFNAWIMSLERRKNVIGNAAVVIVVVRKNINTNKCNHNMIWKKICRPKVLY